MMLVALTGGIGSGKSTVAARFAEHGVPVVDADRIAREVVEPGEPALAELVGLFGEDILRTDGSLDRQALADIVFHDDDARRRVERITHPRVAARIAERLTELAASFNGGPPLLAVIDHPLLVETGQSERFDAVVVVTAPADLRVERLAEERGMDPADAWARIDVQATDEQRCAVADHVIDNGDGLAVLYARSDEVYQELRSQARLARRASA